MNNLKTVTTCLCLISLLQGTGHAQLAAIDPASIALKSRADIQNVFPGYEDEIENWQGHANVELFFIDDRLTMISLTLAQPELLNVAEERIIQMFNIDLPSNAFTPSALSYRYEKLQHQITSVSFIPTSPKYPPPSNPLVKTIHVSFRE